MFKITVAQAHMRLPGEIRRRTEITETIASLERSRRNLSSILKRIKMGNARFLKGELNTSKGDWRGATVSNFHSRNATNMGQFTTAYLNRVGNAITDINLEIGRLNSQLGSTNQTISQLQQVIRNGGI